MAPFKVLSASQQVANHLREEITRGRLQGDLPGIHSLTAELGIHRTSVVEALKILEHEGLIASQGAGKRRKILPLTQQTAQGMCIAILLHNPEEKFEYKFNELRHRLTLAGHTVIVAAKTLSNLKNGTLRLKKLVNNTRADAWVVFSGTRETLKWFVDSDIPVFALFGKSHNLPIPQIGPATVKCIIQVTQKLLELNHQRICFLMCNAHRGVKRTDNAFTQAFEDTLRSYGVTPSIYNFPDWQYTPESLQETLATIFQVTPPTALIIEDRDHLLSVIHFLALNGIKPVKDVSICCLGTDPSFLWTDPLISYTNTDARPWIRRVVQWADNVKMGKKDLKKSTTKPKFIEGGTIGPAPLETV